MVAGSVAEAWFVDCEKHIIRKTDYKGTKQKHELKLAFDALTMPASYFLAAYLQTDGKVSDVFFGEPCVLLLGLCSSPNPKLLGRSAEKHRDLLENVPGKLLPWENDAGAAPEHWSMYLACRNF